MLEARNIEEIVMRNLMVDVNEIHLRDRKGIREQTKNILAAYPETGNKNEAMLGVGMAIKDILGIGNENAVEELVHVRKVMNKKGKIEAAEKLSQTIIGAQNGKTEHD